MGSRSRNLFVLLLVAGLVAGSLVAILLKPTQLGLELKGGVSLVYKGEPTAEAKVESSTIEKSIEIMRQRVDHLGVSQPEISSRGKGEITVDLPNVTNAKRAEEEVGKPAQLYFYDWEPNVIGPSGHPEPEERSVTGGSQAGTAQYGISGYEAVLRGAKRLAEHRINETTYEPGCTLALNEATRGPNHGCIYGSWYLLDTKTKAVLRGPETTRQEALPKSYKPPKGSTAADLEVVNVPPGTIVVRAHPEEGREGKVTKAEPESFYVLKDDYVLTGNSIRNPAQSFEPSTNEPIVTFGFTPEGASIFERVTEEIAERGNEMQIGVAPEEAFQHFAIVLDEQLITVPYINFQENPEGIDASNGSQISGGFTLASAQNLANELQSGALPIKLKLISHSNVSATLGKEALSEGVKAGIIGLLVVCLFLLLFYRMLGLIAIGGLIVYGIYVFALIKLIPITLTLPGMAGVILTIGVAADANIVIFERIKEEIRAGRSIPAGIAAGYKRGFAAIIDANVVTFMTAFILFALATAEVQGFALMLGIGTLTSLFTAVMATQAALGAMGNSRVVGHPAMLGARPRRRSWRFDYMGASRWFFTLSGMILLVGAIAIGARGINFGIDFKGGTQITTAITEPATVGKVKSVLEGAGYPEAQVQRRTSKKGAAYEFNIAFKTLGPKQVTKVQETLNEKFGTATREGVTNFSSTSIGKTFGSAIADAAIIAIIASLLVISVYIALRFEWKYATPVLIALAHDLLITSGVYALTGREVTSGTVAALLTILGYSMYDTIIVFDRIRENVPRMPRAAFSQIVNRSMSEVVTRSLATSFCTLLPVISLLIFGGKTLKDFAFALLVGIASGAYSSIFIASPVLTHWKEREPVYRNRRARLLRDFGFVPAYATATPGGAPIDVEPKAKRRSRGGFLGEDAGQQISKEEFEELVADLDIEQREGGAGRRGGSGTAVASPRPARGRRDAPSRGGGNGSVADATLRPGGGAAPPPAAPEGGTPPRVRSTGGSDSPEPEQRTPPPAADAEPEDVVMKDTPKRREKSRRPRNRRHGRRR
jgi:SecD/SecF fusion protein